MERTVRLHIIGRVQGVGYRAWCARTAQAMGLAGWVRNRIDRSVEMVLQGSSQKVEDMLRLCEAGPRSARVTRVEVLGENAGVYEDFEVLPDA